MTSSYDDTLRYLFALQNRGIKLGLECSLALAALLDNPHKSYPTVLVGGTNGKGSVCAMMAEILKEAGFNVGFYSSPHLVRFNERIRVDALEISDAELMALTARIRSLLEGTDIRPSFFEFTTALALAYFRDKQVDIAILEVGLGGRLDSTNIVDPALSIITPLSLEHISTLGGTLAQIAIEKAGIIREGGKVVSSRQEVMAGQVLEHESRKKGACLFIEGADFDSATSNPAGVLFDYNGMDIKLKDLSLSLRGAHQRSNATVALAGVEALRGCGFSVSESAMRRALLNARWPGRCEVVGREPQIILDCAHNHSSAQALATVLKDIIYKRLVLILGLMADKDIEKILDTLLPLADTVIVTAPDIERAIKPGDLLSKVHSSVITPGEAVAVEGVVTAIKFALKHASKEDLICITGSIFTVGEATTYLKRDRE